MTTTFTVDTFTAALLEGGLKPEDFDVREGPCNCGCGRTTVTVGGRVMVDDDLARVAWRAFWLLDPECCVWECWNSGGCLGGACRDKEMAE